MRKITLIVSMLLLAPALLISTSPVRAQYTQAQINSTINNLLQSCGNGCNTAASLRSLLDIMTAATFQAQGANGQLISATSQTAGAVLTATGATTSTWVNGLPGLGSSVVPAGNSIGVAAGPGLNLNVATQPWIITGTARSPVTDGNGGLLDVSKHTAYSPAAILAGNQPAVYVENLVEDGVWSNTTGLIASIINKNTQHSQPESTASAVASYGTSYCVVVGCSATWAGVFSAYDTTGQNDPIYPIIGIEVDNYAGGTDAHNNRIGLYIVAGSITSAVNTVAHGLLFAGDGSGGASGGQYLNLIDGAGSKVQNGIVFNGMTISGYAYLSPGVSIDGTGHLIVGSTVSGGGADNAVSISGNVTGNLIIATGASVNGVNLNSATFSGAPFLSSGFSVSSTGAITSTLPTSAGSGGLFVCVDTSGVFYKKSTCP